MNWGWVRANVPEGTLNASINTSKVAAFEQVGAAGLLTPRWSKSLVELRKQLPQTRSVIARKDGLSGGRGMELIQPGQELERNFDFFVERLSYLREFRVHVFRDQIIHVQAKFIPPGFSGIAKNFENGCHYTSEQLERFCTSEQLEQAKQSALVATKALKLDFAAIDLLLNKKGKLYFLEANTAPGLRSEASQAAYKKALEDLWRLGKYGKTSN